jgi:putative oxidoreductase
MLGLLIAIGLFTRPAAFMASGVMAVAYFWQKFPDGIWPIDNGGETAVLYCFIFLLLVFTGPGSLAVSRR